MCGVLGTVILRVHLFSQARDAALDREEARERATDKTAGEEEGEEQSGGGGGGGTFVPRLKKALRTPLQLVWTDVGGRRFRVPFDALPPTR